MSFPPEFLKRWRMGDYSLLTSTNIPSYIKQIIVQKAKVRPGRRFFGEAFVAVSFSSKIKDGFYNSYKWLTAKQRNGLPEKNLNLCLKNRFTKAWKQRGRVFTLDRITVPLKSLTRSIMNKGRATETY